MQIFFEERLKNDQYCYEEFFAFFSGINNLPVYTYTLEKGQNLYRARLNESFSNYVDFKELAYPPGDVIKKYSRANKPLQSVLYLSDKWITNLAELKLFLLNNFLVGDVFWVTQAEWVLEENIVVIIIPDFYNKKMQEFIGHKLKKLDELQIEFLKLINKYFKIDANYDIEKYYKLTSAFCNSLFAESIRVKNKVDGVLFTSVRESDGFNLALNKSVVDEKKITLKNVIKHFLHKNEKDEINNFIEPIKPQSLDFENEKIIWT